MKENLFFKKTIKILAYVILPLILIYGVINTNLTGFSINTEKTTQINLVTGLILGITTIFFVLLLVAIKLSEKAYKPTK
jgi:hypothetical protein